MYKLAEQHKRRKKRKAQSKSASSFSSFSSPHAVPLIVSELSLRPGPSLYHDISLSDTHDSMLPPSVTATLTIINAIMGSKLHIFSNPTLSGSQDRGEYEPRCKRQREDYLWSFSSSLGCSH